MVRIDIKVQKGNINFVLQHVNRMNNENCVTFDAALHDPA